MNKFKLLNRPPAKFDASHVQAGTLLHMSHCYICYKGHPHNVQVAKLIKLRIIRTLALALIYTHNWSWGSCAFLYNSKL